LGGREELAGPNGLAFSPDEKYLYVDNWDPAKKIVMRYEVKADGTITPGQVFYDMTDAPGEEALDGLKVDTRGNLYVSGPGGVWLLSESGNNWAPSRPRAFPPTSLGATRTGRRYTSRPEPRSTAFV
jgi:sugar lactone lactonase YvrE